MLRSKLTALAIITLVGTLFFHPAMKTAEGKTPWQLICKKGKPRCHMAAEVRTGNNQVASVFTLERLQPAKSNKVQTVAVLQVPLGLHIPSGVHIRVDKKLTFRANLVDCNGRGCRAAFTTSDEILTALLMGGEATVIIVDSKSRKKVALTYSLIGFTRIWEQLINGWQTSVTSNS